MRGFMRAIGLGGLFRRSRSSSMRTSSFRPIANPFLQSPLQQDKSASNGSSASSSSSRQHMSSMSPFQIEPVRESRTSSIVERPQFLFFCGSESSGRSSSISSRMTATLKQQQPAAPHPVISHRMPVFFAPQCAFPMVSPTSTSARPSESIFH